jgi:hypothetical protein
MSRSEQQGDYEPPLCIVRRLAESLSGSWWSSSIQGSSENHPIRMLSDYPLSDDFGLSG